MPSRMSCSLMTTSSTSVSSSDPGQDQRAGADDVDPAGVDHRHRRALGPRHRQQLVGHLVHLGRRSARRRGSPPGRRRSGRSATAATVVAEPATATSVAASRTGTASSADASAASTTAAAASISAVPGGSDGSDRSVSRTQPMSTDRAAVDLDHCRGPARSIRRRCRRPGTAARCRRRPAGRTWCRGTTSRASSSPLITSGRTPSTSLAASRKSSRLAASRAADVATMRTRSTPSVAMLVGVGREGRRGCGRSPRRRTAPYGRRPHRAGPRVMRRTTSTSESPVDVGDEQPDRVGAAVDRGDPGHSLRPALRTGRWSTTAAAWPAPRRRAG